MYYNMFYIVQSGIDIIIRHTTGMLSFSMLSGNSVSGNTSNICSCILSTVESAM